MKVEKCGKTVRLLMGCCLIGLTALLVACGGSKPVRTNVTGPDRAYLQSSRMARAAFEGGRISQAIGLYHQALDRAYIMDDLNAIVDTRYNLAVCYLRQGEHAAALENLDKAGFDLAMADRRIPSDLLLVKAMALYWRGDPDDAWSISGRLLEEVPTPPLEILAGVRYLRGRIAADRGDLQQLKEEIGALREPTGLRLKANRLDLLGRLAMIERRWDDAVSTLDQVARLRAESRDYRSMASVLATAAVACEQAQRPEAAAYRYLRAARSALLDGDSPRAAAWLQEALRLADQVGAVSIRGEVFYYQSLLAPESPSR